MPHSSGGGSGGGGSHGGGGGHYSGSSSGSGRIVSSRSFPGASRYVYYDNDEPVYVYSNQDLGKKNLSRFLIAPVYLIFYFFLFMSLKNELGIPKKLVNDYSTFVIEDNVNVIDDEDELESTLAVFYDKTGISPAIVTVYNDQWKFKYSSLEDYAYNLYIEKFNDEQHWLIVYSIPLKPTDTSDWYWEGMQGDDTDNILTETKTKKFNLSLQNMLEKGASFGSAVKSTFFDFSKDVMKVSVNFSSIFPSLFGILFVTFHAYIMLGFNKSERLYRKAVKCPENSKESLCPYCGKKFVVGLAQNCPHCNAFISSDYIANDSLADEYDRFNERSDIYDQK